MLKNVISLSAPALLLLLGLVYCGGCHVAPSKPAIIPPGDYTYVADYAECRIHQCMRRHHLPSVAVALIDDQNTVWQGTFGWANVEQKTPARSDSRGRSWGSPGGLAPCTHGRPRPP